MLYEHHRMAQEYGLHPAITFGVDPLRNQLLAYQLMRATFYTGTAIENRLKQTRRELVDLPEQPPKGQTFRDVPMWTYQQAIGSQPPPPEAAEHEASEAAIAERAMQTRREVAPETANLLRGIATNE